MNQKAINAEPRATPTQLHPDRVKILANVFAATANFGAPMLLDEKHWNEAGAMADEGLLERHQAVFNSFAYTVTQSGVDALKLALPPEPPELVVKVWGTEPPKSMKEKRAFIAKQAAPLEQAYWFEHETSSGGYEMATLSTAALDARLKALGYTGWPDEAPDGVNWGLEDRECFPWCDDTGVVLDGGSDSNPSFMIYTLSGFAWRRSERFQMDAADWQEAHGFIEMIDSSTSQGRKLVKFVAESCFIDPVSHNDTGLHNPGGPCTGNIEDLIDLFDFLLPVQH